MKIDKDKYLELMNKLTKQLGRMMAQADEDELIFGNSFWEFSDRAIKVVHPEEVTKKIK